MNIALVVAVISLVVALASLALAWYVSITRPKRIPKPFFIIAPYVSEKSPQRICFRIINAGDATAHDFTLYVRFAEKAYITSLEKGLFNIKEGGEGHHFVKLVRHQVAPHTTLPDVWISAKLDDIPTMPEYYHAECKEIPKIPIPPIVRL